MWGFCVCVCVCGSTIDTPIHACSVYFASDTAVVGVSADPSEPFTVISPADGVYVDDCQPSRPLHCPGVYYMKRTLPSIQDIILKGNKSCSQLGPIDLSIPCSLPNDATTITPYTSIGK